MAAEIRKARPATEVELLGESDRLGMFDVKAGEAQLWSKYETGSFPEPDQIVSQLPNAPTS